MNPTKKIFLLLSVLTILCGSCSSDSEDELQGSNTSITNQELGTMLNNVVTDWTLSKSAVQELMKGYSLLSISDPDVLKYKNEGTGMLISYAFKQDILCASVVLSPDMNLSDVNIAELFPQYQNLGSLSDNSIYFNREKNTIGTFYSVDNNGEQFLSIGFAPIKSSLYETIAPIIVTTGDATDIDYYTATIKVEASGIPSGGTVGVVYGTNSNLNENTGTIKKITSLTGGTVNLKKLNFGTTYYYRGYALVDDIYYWGEVKNFTTLSKTTYEIGEIYPKNGSPEGVIFYLNSEATAGKIVSLDNTHLKWDTSSIFCTDYGNTSSTDGSLNKGPKRTTLAYGWCINHGDGWYLPAKSELVKLGSNLSKVNEGLTAAGGTPINPWFFWSSTEKDNNNAYVVCVGGAAGYASGWTGYNGKSESNSVIAVKKFE